MTNLLIAIIPASIICIYLIVRYIRVDRKCRKIQGFIPQNAAEREAMLEIPGLDTVVNVRLVRERNISLEFVKTIKGLHKRRHVAFMIMEFTENISLLRKLAQEVENIEYKLQACWGFPIDKNYHRWWEVPQCTCPNLDNIDNYGTKYHVIAAGCPVHGHKLKSHN